MYQFFEAGIRGGVASINQRYAEANNKYMGDKFDPSKESSYILYLDMNNLYGYSMSDSLPVGGFEWVPQDDIETLLDNLLNLSPHSDIGYVMEVDLAYPSNLHDLHSSLPLAPEKLSIPFSELSTYCQSFPGPYVSSTKLIPNLRNKERYITHYRNLQLYVQLGMTVTRVHRVVKFRQQPWMAPYIRLNTQMRQQSKSEFEKSFFKLANNSVYGKCNSSFVSVKCFSFCTFIL